MPAAQRSPLSDRRECPQEENAPSPERAFFAKETETHEISAREDTAREVIRAFPGAMAPLCHAESRALTSRSFAMRDVRYLALRIRNGRCIWGPAPKFGLLKSSTSRPPRRWETPGSRAKTFPSATQHNGWQLFHYPFSLPAPSIRTNNSFPLRWKCEKRW